MTPWKSIYEIIFPILPNAGTVSYTSGSLWNTWFIQVLVEKRIKKISSWKLGKEEKFKSAVGHIFLTMMPSKPNEHWECCVPLCLSCPNQSSTKREGFVWDRTGSGWWGQTACVLCRTTSSCDGPQGTRLAQGYPLPPARKPRKASRPLPRPTSTAWLRCFHLALGQDWSQKPHKFPEKRQVRIRHSCRGSLWPFPKCQLGKFISLHHLIW